MTEERLVAGLTAWLQDSEIPPPDARMSASRVMAGVSGTRQLGRWWPPARIVRRARPVPAPRVMVVAPPSAPHPTKGVLSLFTAMRIVTATLVLAFVATGLLVGRTFLPDPVEPLPALTSPSPSPTTEATVEPSLEPEPTAEPEPEPLVPDATRSTAESTFAATGVMYEFAPGVDPISLARGPQKTSLYVDRAAETVYMVAADGYRHTLATAGHTLGEVTLDAPLSVNRGGRVVVIRDALGQVWEWAHNYENAPHWIWSHQRTPEPPPPFVVEPSDVPFDTVSHNSNLYDIYALDPSSGDVLRYEQERHLEWGSPVVQAARVGLPPAIGLHVDPVVFVLTGDGVEKHRDGQRRGYKLGKPPGPAPDYRHIGGIGSDGKGELWLYDAAGDRLVVFDKKSGRYLGSWAPDTGSRGFADVRGFYVEGDGTGAASSVTWMTPDGVMRSAITDETLTVEPARRAVSHDGTLEPSTRTPGPRELAWSSGGVSLEADVLRLKTADKVFEARGEVAVGDDRYLGDVDLELEWFEDGIHQRLLVHASSNETDWWVRDIWAYDGEQDGDWLFFTDLETLTRTPIGQALEGDLRIPNTSAERKKYQPDGSARLVIKGLRLGLPGVSDRPAPLTDCRSVASDVWVDYDGDRGWIVHADDRDTWQAIAQMAPPAAEATIREMGLCYRFGYQYAREPFDSDKLNKYAGTWQWEQRCSAPEHGTITQIVTVADVDASKRILRLDVKDDEVRDLPEPPPYGTGCEPVDAS